MIWIIPLNGNWKWMDILTITPETATTVTRGEYRYIYFYRFIIILYIADDFKSDLNTV